jgi:precorrin-6B methylase 2
MSLDSSIVAYLRKTVDEWPEQPSTQLINKTLRIVARWRQYCIQEAYLGEHGSVIWGGLFKGMDYVDKATEGALLPRLLGAYEAELHPHLRAFAAEGLEAVIDVGCAEGYYAVGLARLMPNVVVHARDTDAKALIACKALAEKNGVADRVILGGEFSPEDFDAFAGKRVLVMVDAEGAEVDVLQPALSPALAGFNIVVETHDIYRAGALATLVERFSPTHDIVRVDQQYLPFDPPPWFVNLGHLDRLIAVWEWRILPTPWLVMRPKAA